VNKPLLLGTAVLVGFLPLSALAQAAAESALTNALSSTTTVKAGSALGHALNQSTTQLGARVQEHTSKPLGLQVQSAHRAEPGTRPLQIQSGGNLRIEPAPSSAVITFQGGEPACSPTAPAAPNSVSKVKSQATPAGCRAKTSATDPGEQDKYKSFVTLPPPK